MVVIFNHRLSRRCKLEAKPSLVVCRRCLPWRNGAPHLAVSAPKNRLPTRTPKVQLIFKDPSLKETFGALKGTVTFRFWHLRLGLDYGSSQSERYLLDYASEVLIPLFDCASQGCMSSAYAATTSKQLLISYF
jgi:hypothetical protein